MNIVLLSGGSGKRLWPLSNDIRSKQFIKIFKKEDGTYESMVQRVYRQIKKVDTDATVTIATSKTAGFCDSQPVGRGCGYQRGALSSGYLPGNCAGNCLFGGCDAR